MAEEVKEKEVNNEEGKKDKKFSLNISDKLFFDQMPFAFFLTLIGVLYIANSYYVEGTMRDMEKIKKNIIEQKNEFVISKTKASLMGQRIEILKIVDTLGINGYRSKLVDKKKSILKRVYFGFLVLFLFGAAVVFQIVKIQWFESKEIVKSVAQTSAGYRPVTADRGDIYATDGSLLATSLTYYNVGMDLSSKALTDENFNKYLSALCDSLATLSSKKMITKTAKQYRAELVKLSRIQAFKRIPFI